MGNVVTVLFGVKQDRIKQTTSNEVRPNSNSGESHDEQVPSEYETADEHQASDDGKAKNKDGPSQFDKLVHETPSQFNKLAREDAADDASLNSEDDDALYDFREIFTLVNRIRADCARIAVGFGEPNWASCQFCELRRLLLRAEREFLDLKGLSVHAVDARETLYAENARLVERVSELERELEECRGAPST
ncbi:uncharacterized protein K452DRAFT_303428 [Aplosporella prunicola CBS 121167]|uniref:Uncharacterized protein n=1 Tax=Aplosporella prunicola CBS 121167 TaxID=1176127 RepID=A0A6A6AVJ4_9PEZI|nr:uncharacterized protein K452DRAFT_303428 [Aplosporella prunicola CBS 121167]KAF2135606.1 hypothetical protein K452DRAFT_303428 [Aplosporella prunicola CBS 121167]